MTYKDSQRQLASGSQKQGTCGSPRGFSFTCMGHRETAGAQGRRSREDSWSESGQQGEYADHTETEKLRRSGQKEKALPSTLDKLT